MNNTMIIALILLFYYIFGRSHLQNAPRRTGRKTKPAIVESSSEEEEESEERSELHGGSQWTPEEGRRAVEEAIMLEQDRQRFLSGESRDFIYPYPADTLEGRVGQSDDPLHFERMSGQFFSPHQLLDLEEDEGVLMERGDEIAWYDQQLRTIMQGGAGTSQQPILLDQEPRVELPTDPISTLAPYPLPSSYFGAPRTPRQRETARFYRTPENLRAARYPGGPP